jgi:hypothetical protein
MPQSSQRVRTPMPGVAFPEDEEDEGPLLLVEGAGPPTYVLGFTQCGYDAVRVPLAPLLAWLRANRPDLLA